MPISVLIADDHQLVRQGLRALLEGEGFKVVGDAANGQEAVALTIELHAEWPFWTLPCRF
jgi:two-component system, NarL family, response regulator LiaR